MENNGSYSGSNNASYIGIYQAGIDQLTYVNFLNGIGNSLLNVTSKQGVAEDPIAQELAGIMEFSGLPDVGNFVSKYTTVKLVRVLMLRLIGIFCWIAPLQLIIQTQLEVQLLAVKLLP